VPQAQTRSENQGLFTYITNTQSLNVIIRVEMFHTNMKPLHRIDADVAHVLGIAYDCVLMLRRNGNIQHQGVRAPTPD
jgi:hypothetical protein